LAEFAIVLPLLLALVTAIVELGLAFSHYVTLTDAARAGARAGAVSGTGAVGAVRSAVRRSAGDLPLADDHIAVTYDGPDVTVTATYDDTIRVFGFPVAPVHLHATTTERVE
jgi:Flp pilus assembly protein TadG